MVEKNEDQEQYPYYNHDSEEWRPLVNAVSAAFLGILVIYGACTFIPKDKGDQFWNVFLIGSVTWMICVTAWVQIYINKRQWQAMKDGLQETRTLIEQGRENLDFTKSSFYLAERAYVSVRGLMPTITMAANACPRFGYVLENGGRTPAFNVSVPVYTAISNTTEPVEWRRAPDSFFGTDFLMPNKPTERIEADGFFSLTDEQFEEWIKSKLIYYVKVDLSYWDISHNKVFTPYIFYIHPLRGGVLQLMPPGLVPDREKA